MDNQNLPRYFGIDLTDWILQEPEPERNSGLLGDTGTDVTVGTGGILQGLAAGWDYAANKLAHAVTGENIPVENTATGALNRAGFDDWMEGLKDEYSNARRESDAAVREAVDSADNETDKGLAAVFSRMTHPRTTFGEAMQAIPGMVLAATGGGVAGFGARVVAGANVARAATLGAAGTEGTLAGGNAVHDIMESNIAQGKDPYANTDYAIPVGLGTAAISAFMPSAKLEGAIFNKEARDLLRPRAHVSPTATGFRKVAQNLAPLGKSMLGEGAEEALQAPFETIPVNLATDKPWSEGLGENIGASAMADAFMGGAAHGLTYRLPEEPREQYRQGEQKEMLATNTPAKADAKAEQGVETAEAPTYATRANEVQAPAVEPNIEQAAANVQPVGQQTPAAPVEPPVNLTPEERAQWDSLTPEERTTLSSVGGTPAAAPAATQSAQPAAQATTPAPAQASAPAQPEQTPQRPALDEAGYRRILGPALTLSDPVRQGNIKQVESMIALSPVAEPVLSAVARAKNIVGHSTKVGGILDRARNIAAGSSTVEDAVAKIDAELSRKGSHNVSDDELYEVTKQILQNPGISDEALSLQLDQKKNDAKLAAQNKIAADKAARIKAAQGRNARLHEERLAREAEKKKQREAARAEKKAAREAAKAAKAAEVAPVKEAPVPVAKSEPVPEVKPVPAVEAKAEPAQDAKPAVEQTPVPEANPSPELVAKKIRVVKAWAKRNPGKNVAEKWEQMRKDFWDEPGEDPGPFSQEAYDNYKDPDEAPATPAKEPAPAKVEGKPSQPAETGAKPGEISPKKAEETAPAKSETASKSTASRSAVKDAQRKEDQEKALPVLREFAKAYFEKHGHLPYQDELSNELQKLGINRRLGKWAKSEDGNLLYLRGETSENYNKGAKHKERNAKELKEDADYQEREKAKADAAASAADEAYKDFVDSVLERQLNADEKKQDKRDVYKDRVLALELRISSQTALADALVRFSENHELTQHLGDEEMNELSLGVIKAFADEGLLTGETESGSVVNKGAREKILRAFAPFVDRAEAEDYLGVDEGMVSPGEGVDEDALKEELTNAAEDENTPVEEPAQDPRESEPDEDTKPAEPVPPEDEAYQDGDPGVKELGADEGSLSGDDRGGMWSINDDGDVVSDEGRGGDIGVYISGGKNTGANVGVGANGATAANRIRAVLGRAEQGTPEFDDAVQKASDMLVFGNAERGQIDFTKIPGQDARHRFYEELANIEDEFGLSDGPFTNKLIDYIGTLTPAQQRRMLSELKNAGKTGSTPAQISEALRSDKDLGKAAARLEKEGKLEVVASEEALLKRMADENARRGRAAMDKLLTEHKDVPNAMSRPDIGNIDFLHGSVGEPEIKGKKQTRKGAHGILHIIEARYRKDGYPEAKIKDLLYSLVNTIAYGKLEYERSVGGSTNYRIEDDNYAVAIARIDGHNGWVITGYKKVRKPASGEIGKAYDSTNPTSAEPTSSRLNEGAVADAPVTILGNTFLTVKKSATGRIQGMFDGYTGKVYLVADSLTPQNARNVLLHEVGVHMAFEGSPLMNRASFQAISLIDRGARSGDPVLTRIKQRLVDAGHAGSMHQPLPQSEEVRNEAMAYLVEEASKAEPKSALGRWWQSVVSAIKAFFLKHTKLPVALKPQDYVAIAKANVRKLSEKAGTPTPPRGGRPMFSVAATEQAAADAGKAGASVQSAFRKVQDAAISHMPKRYQPAARAFGRTLGDWSRSSKALSLFFTRDLVALGEKYLPSMKKVFDLEKLSDDVRNMFMAKASEIRADYDQFDAKSREKMNDVMTQMVTEEAWVYNEPMRFKDQAAYDKYEAGKKSSAEYQAAKKQWDALSTEEQGMVKRVFRHGIETQQALRDAAKKVLEADYAEAIANATSDEEKKRLTAERNLQIKDAAPSGFSPYIPLKRFGKYVVVVRSKAYMDAVAKAEAMRKLIMKMTHGKPTEKQLAPYEALRSKVEQMEHNTEDYQVEMRDTAWQANTLANELRDRYKDSGYSIESSPRLEWMHSRVPQYQALQSVLNRLEEQNDPDNPSLAALKRTARDMWITSLKEESAQKAKLKRRVVKGFNDDMMENFMEGARGNALLAATLEYHPQISKAITEMVKEARHGTSDRSKAIPFANEMLARREQVLSGGDSKLVGNVMASTSAFMLLTNPAFYIQNALQPYMMSAPYLAGRFGVKAFGQLLSEHTKIARLLAKGGTITNVADQMLESKQLKQAEYGALMDARKSGLVDIGITQDFGNVSTSNSQFGKAFRKGMELFRGAARRVEIANRMSTYLTAYRMAKEAGDGEQVARDYASKVVYETHGDYSSLNAPRVMQLNGFMRVATQFRKFQLIQLGMFVKMLHDALRHENPRVKAVAKRELLWTLGVHFLMTGVKGAPFMMAVAGLAAAFGGEDDEDAEEYVRRSIGDKQVSDLFMRGLPAALGVDLSEKIGAATMTSLLPYFDFNPTDGRANAEALALQLAGPAGGIAARASEAYKWMALGDYWKAMEQILPNGLFSNGLKAARFATEGLTTKSGDRAIMPDDFDGMDLFMQVVGLPTSKITDRNRIQGNLIRHENTFDADADKIRADFRDARRAKDWKGMQEARKEWMELNDRRKAMGFRAVPVSQLSKASNDQAKRERRSVAGVISDRSNAGYLKSRKNQ